MAMFIQQSQSQSSSSGYVPGYSNPYHGSYQSPAYNHGPYQSPEYNRGSHNAGEYNGGPPNSGENNRGSSRDGEYHYGPRKSHKYRPEPYDIEDSRDRNMIPLTTFNRSGRPNEEVIPTVSGQMEPPEQRINHTGQDKANEGCFQASLAMTIFFRTLSVGFICLNIAADWIEYNDWSRDEADASSDAVSIAASIFGRKDTTIDIECSDRTDATIISLAAINLLGSLMALIQIVDTVGETVLEASQNRHGFQILHGWIETVLTLLLEEIPQAVIVLLINNSCRYNVNVSVFSLITIFIGLIKTSSRMWSCKQIKIDCKCCDCSECCMHTLPIPCACTTLVCQPCAKTGDSCLRFEKWDICELIPCNCNGKSCFDGYDQDPNWAKYMFGQLSSLHFWLLLANIAFFVLRQNDVFQIDLLQEISTLLSN